MCNIATRLDGSADSAVLSDNTGDKPLTSGSGGSYAASVRTMQGGGPGTPPPPLTSQGTPPGKHNDSVPAWGTQSYANVLRHRERTAAAAPPRPQTIDDVLREDLGSNYAGNVTRLSTPHPPTSPPTHSLLLLLLLLLARRCTLLFLPAKAHSNPLRMA